MFHALCSKDEKCLHLQRCLHETGKYEASCGLQCNVPCVPSTLTQNKWTVSGTSKVCKAKKSKQTVVGETCHRRVLTIPPPSLDDVGRVQAYLAVARERGVGGHNKVRMLKTQSSNTRSCCLFILYCFGNVYVHCRTLRASVNKGFPQAASRGRPIKGKHI